MRSYDSLRRRSDFHRVRARGRRRDSPHLRFFVLPIRGNDARSRVGFVISTAVGGAVERNRLRRRLRAILDEHGLVAPNDFVIVAHPGSAGCGFGELHAEVLAALADLSA